MADIMDYKGWQCPVCNRVYSPTVPECSKCEPSIEFEIDKCEHVWAIKDMAGDICLKCDANRSMVDAECDHKFVPSDGGSIFERCLECGAKRDPNYPNVLYCEHDWSPEGDFERCLKCRDSRPFGVE